VTLECTESGAILSASIEAAWLLVPPGGRLVLVDRTGTPGGEAVRRALFRFLERHANVRSRHGRFFDPHSEISWIESGPATEESVGIDLDKFTPNHASVAARLTSLLVERLRPRSMLDIGCGAGHWLRAFEQHGVPDVQGVEDRALLAASSGTTAMHGVTGVDLADFRPARQVDLCLCLCVLQRVPAQTAEAIVAASTRASDTVVFSAPAPGRGAAGSVNERPWIVWHRLFWSHGFVPCDELRPLIEERWGRYPSSYDLLVVYRRMTAEYDRASPSAAMESAMLGAAQRIDDQILQGHWFSLALNAIVKPTTPRLRYEPLEIEPARMQAGGSSSARVFSFRTSGAMLALAAGGIEMPIVEENGRPLARMKTTEQIRTGQPGLFAIEDGTVTFSSFDGRDPRHNGRTYAIRVPAHVAWLERLPIATILEHQL
jgi:SAM-dependent methyltransferase